MGITQLEISNVRNLKSIRIDLNPGLNGFCGANGSGKTSLLEALYILGRGTSFKTNDLNRVLHYGAQKLIVAGKLAPSNTALGVEYQPQSIQFRIAGQSVRSRLALASHLPLLFISPESHALISEGPQQRRRFLNWGVFHVEPRFLPTWRLYQRALKQRNKALGSRSFETAWDIELARAAEQITQFRRDYIAKLDPYVDHYVQRLVKLEKVSLNFSPGWRQDIDCLEALRASLPYDREHGFTRLGPHRADLVLKVGNRPAREFTSRGQQKLLVIAMLLAQVALLNQVAFIQPVILIDDLASELDIYHRQQLLSVLFELKAQIFLTLTEKQSLPVDEKIPIRWFHVEQGQVTSE